MIIKVHLAIIINNFIVRSEERRVGKKIGNKLVYNQDPNTLYTITKNNSCQSWVELLNTRIVKS